MDDWFDVTADIDIGEDGRHLSGHYPRKPEDMTGVPIFDALPKCFIWNAVPEGFRIRRVDHIHLEGDQLVDGVAFIVERLA